MIGVCLHPTGRAVAIVTANVNVKGLAALAAAPTETIVIKTAIGTERREGEAGLRRGEGACPQTGGGMTEPEPLLLRTRKKMMIGPKPRHMITEHALISCLLLFFFFALKSTFHVAERRHLSLYYVVQYTYL